MKNIRILKPAFKSLCKKIVVETIIVNDISLAGCLIINIFIQRWVGQSGAE